MIISKIAKNFPKYFVDIMMFKYGWIPPKNFTIELVPDFDRSNVNYIL